MKIKVSPFIHSLFIVILLVASTIVPASAQTMPTTGLADEQGPQNPEINPNVLTLTENFDDITTLVGNGWFMQNSSAPVGVTNWFQGTSISGGGPFDSQAGAANAYIGANYNNVANVGTISNWLILPNMLLNNGDQISFYTRTTPPQTQVFPDRLEVRMSTNGTSTNVGTTATSVGDFATLLLTINPSLTSTGYPSTWTNFTVTISGLSAPTSGRLAFRYFVINAGPNGLNSDYIGIDTVTVTANQQPAANAGTDQKVFTSTPIALVGGGIDPDGNTPLSYNWTQTSGTPVTLDNPSLQNPTFTTPSDETVLTFSLVVTDSLGAQSTPSIVNYTVINHKLYLPAVSR